MVIEAQAKRRLADEYDAAQERGEVRRAGNSSTPEELVSAADLGLTHKDIHEARQTGKFADVEGGPAYAGTAPMLEEIA